MKIFGMEKMSLVDYDGLVATTLFTGGCNFRCPFCHNAPLVEGYDALPPISEQEVIEYLQKRKGVIDGVCVSGGEPTLYSDLPIFMEKIKNLGYKIKLDTNGTNPELVKTLHQNGLCDYFAMDIKNDFESYSKIVGIDNYNTDKVRKTAEYFLTTNVDYEFRTTLIKEFHQKENIEKIASEIKGANKYFLQKFKDSGNCLNASSLSPVNNESVLAFVEILKPFVQHIGTRGYDF